MAPPGSFEVSETGAAVYTIPIEASPGTAGMKPSLSLQYNSNGGNGLLGMGWTLSGLPAITRCPKTLAQDGSRGGINHDSDDRFCLEDQKLIATSGTYGADGTEYRTEREGFSKIVSNGTAGSGPSWFKVWTKAGQIMEFGNTSDSRIEAQGKSTARLWAVNKVSDTKGNYFTVSYTEDGTNGEYRPDRIDYTGNAGASLSTYASVRFTYETRPSDDTVPLYEAGSLIKTTKRLINVKTYVGNDVVRDYQLAYEQSSATKRSRVTSVTLCDGAGTPNCLPAISFTWTSGSGSTYSQAWTSTTTPMWQENTYSTFSVDIAGDGRTDVVQNAKVNTNTQQVVRSNGDGTYTQIYSSTSVPFWTDLYYPSYPLDYNGDGKTDFLQLGRSNDWQHILRSNGDGTFTEVWTSSGSSGTFYQDNSYATFLVDVNGDGRTDIVQNAKVNTNVQQVMLSNGDGTFTQAYSSSSVPFWTDLYYPSYPLDYNGDGKTDFLQLGRSNDWQHILRSNGDGTFTEVWTSGGSSGTFWQDNSYSTFLVDVNGDGKTDIVQIGKSNNNVQVMLSKGDGTFTQAYTSTTAPFWDTNSYATYPIDFNGDGKADFLQIGKSNDSQHILRSNGDGTFTEVWTSGGSSGTFWQDNSYLTAIVDLDGDGRGDVLQIGRSGTTQQSMMPSGSRGDFILTITSGIGATTTISYAPLSSGGTLYTKDTGGSACSYPCVDLQGPIFVVSQVETSNGIGGTYTSSYRYVGAKADLSGRGFLGFRQMIARDEQTKVEQASTYRQDWPFVGLVSERTKALTPPAVGSAVTLNKVTNTYGCTNITASSSNCTGQAAGTRYFVNLATSVESSFELSGTALPVVRTSNSYDSYGNATSVAVETGSLSGATFTGNGFSKTTTNTFTNDATNWLLGRLTRAEVASVTP